MYSDDINVNVCKVALDSGDVYDDNMHSDGYDIDVDVHRVAFNNDNDVNDDNCNNFNDDFDENGDR